MSGVSNKISDGAAYFNAKFIVSGHNPYRVRASYQLGDGHIEGDFCVILEFLSYENDVNQEIVCSYDVYWRNC